MDADRRKFLKTAGLVGMSATCVDVLARQANGSGGCPPSDDAMGVLVDLTKCNGCRQCEAACREAAGFEVPTREELLDDSVFANRRYPPPPPDPTELHHGKQVSRQR